GGGHLAALPGGDGGRLQHRGRAGGRRGGLSAHQRAGRPKGKAGPRDHPRDAGAIARGSWTRRSGPRRLHAGSDRLARPPPGAPLPAAGDRSGRGRGEDRGPGPRARGEELGGSGSDPRRAFGDGRGDHGLAGRDDMESARMKRLVALVLIALGACGSEPAENDGEPRPVNWDVRIPGMEGTARASFDEHGVLHVRCLTDGDCLRVLGYFHASHRFFQMDLQRRMARGTLATLVGAYPISADVYNRLMFSTAEGEPIEEAIWGILGAEERALVEAYVQGVNAWLADLREGRNGVKLPQEYAVLNVVAEAIPEWEALDTLACARLMTYLLSASEDSEMEWGAAFSRLAAESVDAAVDLFTLRPAAKVYTLPQGEGPAALRIARPEFDRASVAGLVERLARARPLLERALAEREGTQLLFGYREAFGSNNWVVGPSRTKNGTAILANDPHLQLTSPPVFYLANIDAKSEGRGTLHVAGATFPGIPAVVIGRNERVAWGATVAFYDVTDVYVETLSEDGRSVVFDGEE